MFFTSTRSSTKKFSFKETLFSGVASDGGLYFPESLPLFTHREVLSFRGKSYLDIAFEVIRPFLVGLVTDDDLKKIVHEAYSNEFFKLEDKVELRRVTRDFYLLELFHGPTLAFKDFALQFLARLMNHFLEKEAKKILILGATSGDTGSASIQAFKSIPSARVFILHPHEKITLKQRKQMTTETSANVFNIAIKGDFDDCQSIVKSIFKSHQAIKEHQLVSINSINFARIIPQIVYYFYAFSRIENNEKGVNFVVPTGNFGNVFAGYLAKKMGLPIKKLVIATNENDVLHQFLVKNEYLKKELKKTFSPSMDIVISSNFERLLFEAYHHDHETVRDIMQDLMVKKRFVVDPNVFKSIKEAFLSLNTSNQETLKIIGWFYEKHKVVIDPHTATAIKWLYEKENSFKEKSFLEPTVALATAHPAKFDEVYKLLNRDIAFTDPLKGLLPKEEKFSILEKSTKNIIAFIQSKLE